MSNTPNPYSQISNHESFVRHNSSVEESIHRLWPIHFPDDTSGYATSSSSSSSSSVGGPNEHCVAFVKRLVKFFERIADEDSKQYINSLDSSNSSSNTPSSSMSSTSSSNIPRAELQSSRASLIESLHTRLATKNEKQELFESSQLKHTQNAITQQLPSPTDSSSKTNKTCEVIFCHTSLFTLLSILDPSNIFEEYMYHNPAQALACLGMAVGVHQKKLDTLFTTKMYNLSPKYCLGLREIVSSVNTKFVSLKVHCLRASPKKLFVTETEFVCAKCEVAQPWKFTDGTFSEPTKCTNRECKSRKFDIIRSVAKFIDCQKLTIQELDDNVMGAGRIPRRMECECRGDAVASCNSGDTIVITGTIRSINASHHQGKGGKASSKNALHILYIEANFIQNISDPKKTRTSAKQSGNVDHNYTDDQLTFIAALPNYDPGKGLRSERAAFPFDLLVASLCPEIYGHELVKAGLLLALLGGTRADASEKMVRDSIQVRSNIHVLIVGDPGMGKSQLLRRTSDVAARSVFVGGGTSTTTGLTVSISKEGKNGDVDLQAGALVLADGGVCCIDEFDKMTADPNGLLEAMEQQQISVAKSGVCASLSARCSIIAAANPKNGSYSRDKSVGENLNMKGPLLSRFDLVYILKDDANKDHDELLANHIFSSHEHEKENENRNENENGVGEKRKGDFSKSSMSNGFTMSQASGVSERTDLGASFGASSTASNPPTSKGDSAIQKEMGVTKVVNRIKHVVKTQNQLIPLEMVKSYITYVKEYVDPKMTKKAAMVIMEFYLDLRSKSALKNSGGYKEKGGGVPITTRQLESMIRLCQARAKACMRMWVTEDDAKDVVEIMKLSVYDVNVTESGSFDVSRGGAGGKSKKHQKDQVTRVMKDYKKEGKRQVTLADIRVKLFQMSGIAEWEEFHDIINEMCNDDTLLKQRTTQVDGLTGKRVWCYRLSS